ncbi:hypothetical protein [Geoanaerobacter pelophilus]|uniref:hypothetical protein n=1 Tax=Geoanaerobacter pelophilus TaxID=60036 RepID=UPI000A271C37|nr:hypothetical protein [Geoanaerobacter pelophilus]
MTRFFTLFLILLLLTASEAGAAPRGLLLLGDLSQLVEFKYQLDGQQTKTNGRDKTSRMQNYFQESYRAQIAYALFNPEILRGSFGVGIDFDQTSRSMTNSASEFNTGSGLRYNISASLLPDSIIPATVQARSEKVHAQRQFQSPYDITTDSYGANLRIKNKHLPITLQYATSSSATTGLSQDTMQDSHTFMALVNHHVSFSESEAQLTLSDNSSAPKSAITSGYSVTYAENQNYEVALRNRLSLAKQGADRMLLTTVQKRDERNTLNADVQENRTFQVEEQLYWAFGKALRLGGQYLLLNRDSTLNDSRNRDAQLSLSHQLFESLATRIETTYRTTDIENSSNETTRGYGGSLNYTKKLPAECELQAGYGYLYTETDRSQTGIFAIAIDEPHTMQPGVLPTLPAPFRLNNINVQTPSIEIRNANPAVHLLPYVLGQDYTIESDGLYTRIVPTDTSEIHVGDNLLVDYSYLGNPQIAYGTTTQQANVNLTLFNNSWRVYGGWLNTSQELLKGSADVVRLNDGTEYRIGFERNEPILSYGGEYDNVDSTQDKHQTYQAFVRSMRNVNRGNVTLYATDSFTNTDQASYNPTGASTATNTFGCGGSYSTRIYRGVFMMLTGQYYNTTGDTPTRNDASLGANFNWSYGKLDFSLISQINWRSLPGQTSQDEYIRLKVSRYF